MPRKNVKLGQNFLVDKFVITRIVELVNSSKNLPLVEIGPGLGALTIPLLSLDNNITAIEIDSSLIAALEARLVSPESIKFINCDVMRADFRSIYLDLGGNKLCIFGNLPYQISAVLMLRLRNFQDIIGKMIFMVQKEVAERLVATPGSPFYGRLSVMVQSWCRLEHLLDVGPGSFSPPPKVDSTVFCASPYVMEGSDSLDWLLFEKVVGLSFRHKRKILYSSFKKVLTIIDWQKLELSSKARPSDLSVNDYVKITKKLQEFDGSELEKKLFS
ncbi:MAG: 16S rRNA (adenine(1518)-N(6)/adenine(1519)-N(6))-dimethyltransferase RsmA [Pseudomonadota bacterium]|nr:16S rRNA (adenine(1518)-N(6)/adenine(1519)-N(6))-dimethyltransferase RsmA [Pseudomonadota bacterium]